MLQRPVNISLFVSVSWTLTSDASESSKNCTDTAKGTVGAACSCFHISHSIPAVNDVEHFASPETAYSLASLRTTSTLPWSF